MKKVIISLIILVFLGFALAGSSLAKIGEWLEVNLFTLSTKEKQLKRVEFAGERVEELKTIVDASLSEGRRYQRLLRNYKYELLRAQDMAEKILILDGAELPLALEFEKATRLYEQKLSKIFSQAQDGFEGILLEAITATRVENQDMFDYIVKNYQFTEEDIELYNAIVREHIAYIEGEISVSGVSFSAEQQEQIDLNLGEAEKFLDAGLNTEAYEYMDRVKNTFYAALRD